ncbi:MAG: hypothetical protein QOK43_2136 [Acidimicrobiaceae bacterium]|nr:hypothetical protein [Acidimicrobiaceae bacterium]
MAAYRLRVELPDQPGALALVAGSIAAHDGNVVSIDIHELDGAKAVDEIVVDGPPDWDTTGLARQLAEAGAELLSCGLAEDRMDPMVRGLRYAGALVASDPSRDTLELGRAVLELTSATAAWVSTRTEAAAYEAGRRAMAHDGPIVMRTADLPASVKWDVRGAVWLLAVPDGRLEPALVAFATRPLALRFTTSEITRVEALLALHGVLTDRAAVAR